MKKSFSQNLLVDKNYLNKIIESVDLKPSDTILEIGAGTGLLTVPLAKIAKKVFAVEIERDILKTLRNNLNKSSINNVEIIEKNILNIDFSDLIKNNFKIVGNIPYNITVPILLKIFGEIDSPVVHLPLIQTVYLMVQYEVAERIVAKPNSKAYSPLTLLIQFFSEPSILFKAPASSFYPKPKVDSAFVQFKIKNKFSKVQNPLLLKTIIRASFQQRRKKVINNLNSLFGGKEQVINLFNKLGFDLNLRAENLEMKDYIALSEAI